MAEPYHIQFAPEAENDVAGPRAFDARAVLTAKGQHLRHAPTQESRSRIKRVVPPSWCQYRLRVGDLRVYSDVDEAGRAVSVIRVLFNGTGTTPEEQP